LCSDPEVQLQINHILTKQTAFAGKERCGSHCEPSWTEALAIREASQRLHCSGQWFKLMLICREAGS
jgi:hypothetical protein